MKLLDEFLNSNETVIIKCIVEQIQDLMPYLVKAMNKK